MGQDIVATSKEELVSNATDTTEPTAEQLEETAQKALVGEAEVAKLSPKEINYILSKAQIAHFVLVQLFNTLNSKFILSTADKETELLAKYFNTSFGNKIVKPSYKKLDKKEK